MDAVHSVRTDELTRRLKRGQGKMRLAGVCLGWHNPDMEPATDLALFVYGSLVPGGEYWPRFCEGRVVARQPACVRGQLYRLGDGYLAVQEPAGQESDPWVRGWWLLLNSDDALRAIDGLEGFDPTKPLTENAYLRRRVECFADDPKAEAPASLGQVWIYTMTAERLVLEGAIAVSHD